MSESHYDNFGYRDGECVPVADYDAAVARTEAAEATVERVRELTEGAPIVAVHAGGGNLVDRRRMVSADDLRAALDGGEGQ